MTIWRRLEILPDVRVPRRWVGSRNLRHKARELRIEDASRDGIFFAGIAARASHLMSWTILFLIGAVGNALGSRSFSTDQQGLKVAVVAAAAVCLLAGVASAIKAGQFERELSEAIMRRVARARSES